MQSLLLVVTAIAVLGLSAARGDDWPHWRGPDRNDHSPEDSGFSAGHWPLGDADWNASLGIGSASPIVVGDRLYTLGWHEGREHVVCLDIATGKTLWSESYPAPQYGRKATGDEGIYGGPSSTPEYDPATKLLYTLGADGDLHCWRTATGKQRKVWGKNLYQEYDPPQRPRFGRSGLRDYGYTSSPLVQGDVLIVEVGDEEGTLMAFDKRSGQRRWKSECIDAAGHSGGPVPMTVEGVPCVAVLTCQRLLVARIDAKHAGQTVAQFDWATDFANNIATPAVQDDCVLITSAYNQNALCKLQVSLDGAKELWRQPYPSKVCSPIIHDGHVYLAWQKLRCLDFETGELRWEGGQFGDDGSCLLTADKRLLVWGRGSLALANSAEQSPGGYQELARHNGISGSDVWPHIVLAQGRVFCKDRQGALRCFRVKRPEG